MERIEYLSDSKAAHEWAERAFSDCEVENNLPLGILLALARSNRPLPEGTLILRMGDNRLALQTPPRLLILSSTWDPQSLLVLSRELRSKLPGLPGVSGEKSVIAEFLKAWGGPARCVMDQGLYKLEELSAPPKVEGEMGLPTAEDLPLIERWAVDFHRESLAWERIDEHDFVLWARRTFDLKQFRVWRHAEKVTSWAGRSGETKFGRRIGPVFTPLDFRGRGFGTALSWAISRELLQEGKKYCCLFTDLANPTSNSIYQKIGYQWIGQYQNWIFEK